MSDKFILAGKKYLYFYKMQEAFYVKTIALMFVCCAFDRWLLGAKLNISQVIDADWHDSYYFFVNTVLHAIDT